jgi:hypothetical protein
MRIPQPIDDWLIDHSHLYRRWINWRFKRSMRRLERTIGRGYLPAMKRTTAALIEWHNSYRT